MSSLKSKTVFIRDFGLYAYLAERFARDCGKVYYQVPNDEDPYATTARDEIGTGLPNVTRISGEDDFWELVDSTPRKIDFFVFPDVGEGGLQEHLRRLGYPVYGSGESQILELDKALFNNKVLPKAGLPYVPMERIRGTYKLREYLKGKKDLYIKISWHRGVFESVHFVDMDEFEEVLVDIEHRLGKRRKYQEFLVHPPIRSKLEIGKESWNIDGEYPEYEQIGIEDKDAAYLGKVVKALPLMFRNIDEKMRPIFKKYGYRGSYATEYRVTDEPYSKEFRGKPYYIDLTAREPSPPGEIRSENYTNFPQCAWDVANGKIPSPKFEAPYVAQIVLLSSWLGENHWLRVDIPQEARRWVKLKNYCLKDGKYWVIPNGNGDFVGAAIGLGKTVEEAIKNCLRHAGMVQAKELSYKKTAFDDIKKSLQEARKFGITI